MTDVVQLNKRLDDLENLLIKSHGAVSSTIVRSMEETKATLNAHTEQFKTINATLDTIKSKVEELDKDKIKKDVSFKWLKWSGACLLFIFGGVGVYAYTADSKTFDAKIAVEDTKITAVDTKVVNHINEDSSKFDELIRLLKKDVKLP